MTAVEALRECVCRTYLALGRNAPDALIEEIDGFCLCKGRLRHPIANFGIRFAGETFPHRLAMEALGNPHFRAYFLSGDTPSDLPILAAENGLRERYELAGLALRKVSDPGIEEATQVESQNDAQSVAEFIADTFFWRSPRRTRVQLATVMASCYPAHRFYAIRDESGFLAAGTLTLDEEVIGLYNLCVRHDVRSLGIGSSLTSQLSRLAAEMADHVVLLCEPDLIPWYSRLGYENVGSLRAFSA